MNSQPNEIITHILSYLDNDILMFARSTCHKWKHLIETRIFYKSTIPALHMCILTNDYYHFGKYYLNYNYNPDITWINLTKMRDVIYYYNLVTILPNRKFFSNVIRLSLREKRIIGSFHDPVIPIPRKNLNLSINQLLIYAAYRGHLEVTKYLISIGADCHANNDYALQKSAQNGRLEVVKYLISVGADLHADNECALRWSVDHDQLETVKYLISVGVNRHVNNDYVLRKGTPEIIEFIKSISEKN